MRFGLPVLVSALLGALLLAGAAAESQALPPEQAPTCGQKGRVAFDKDTILVDASGRKLARFSGGESAVSLLAPPVSGSDLVRIETGTGRGSFRLAGFVKAAELRVYAGVRTSKFNREQGPFTLGFARYLADADRFVHEGVEYLLLSPAV